MFVFPRVQANDCLLRYHELMKLTLLCLAYLCLGFFYTIRNSVLFFSENRQAIK